MTGVLVLTRQAFLSKNGDAPLAPLGSSCGATSPRERGPYGETPPHNTSGRIDSDPHGIQLQEAPRGGGHNGGDHSCSEPRHCRPSGCC